MTFSLALPLAAQERGSWLPLSKTAQSITGDVTFNGDKMTINFFTLTVAEIRPLKPAELSAAFSDASADVLAGGGHLYRLSIPGSKRFLHKNTLCGSDETQWIATYVSGKQLEIAFFSNAAPPVFTLEALRDSPKPLRHVYLRSLVGRVFAGIQVSDPPIVRVKRLKNRDKF